MEYLLIFLIGYLVGCFNMAYIISKFKKVDLKKNGTGNLGASNATILLGKRWGLITLICDIFKAFIVIFLFKNIFFINIEYSFIIGGLSVIIGHIFPFYLKFKGGKGFASYLGFMLGVDFKAFLILIGIIVLVVLISDYIVIGTLSCTIFSPIYLFISFGLVPCILSSIISLIIIIKHRKNFIDIKNKKERSVRKILFKK